MRAVFRLGYLLLAGALALAPATALAQEASPADSNTPAADAIGPKALQNFSLNGTVTRPADQPAAVAPPATQKRPTKAQSQVASPTVEPSTSLTDTAPAPSPQTASPEPTPTRTPTAEVPRAAAPQATSSTLQQSPPSASVTTALPTLDPAGGTNSASTPPSTPAGDFAPAPGTDHKLPILPWLLAALALAAGGAFLFWRNQRREAFAGGPQVDAFVAPEPVPAAAPRPVPTPPPAVPKATPPAPVGIVSTRLRPWIDLGFQPVRCVLDDEHVTVEFELELFNSGSAPARAVLVEATLFNAGPAQDQQIDGFFTNPVGQGERITVIPPLKRVGIRTQVSAPRTQIQAYELGGREVFVPIIAFNSLYSWGGGEGQTSASYLLGKDTKGEKLAPFRLDLGPRIFRGLAAHLLPSSVRN